jgi:hypothetical protein
MSAAVALFAGEFTLPGGETVAVPDALTQAIADASADPIDESDLGMARTAFGERLVQAMFARGLIMVPRGRPASRMTVDIDAYSLVCMQKHALQHRLAAIAMLFRGGLEPDQGELLEDFRVLADVLGGHRPTVLPGDDFERARQRIEQLISDIDRRLEQVHRLAFDLPEQPAPASAAEPPASQTVGVGAGT